MKSSNSDDSTAGENVCMKMNNNVAHAVVYTGGVGLFSMTFFEQTERGGRREGLGDTTSPQR